MSRAFPVRTTAILEALTSSIDDIRKERDWLRVELAAAQDRITDLEHDLAQYVEPVEPGFTETDWTNDDESPVDDSEWIAECVEEARAWAIAHQGERYQRPHGKVIYTVTGKVGADPAPGCAASPFAVVVRRSSDNRFSPYFPADLEAMRRLP